MKRADFFKSDYLKAADVKDKSIVAKIHSVKSKHFEGDPNPKAMLVFEDLDQMLTLNATNWDTIESFFGDDPDAWVGGTIEMYHDPNVRNLQGQLVGGVRIRIPEGGDNAMLPLLSIEDAIDLCTGAGISKDQMVEMLKSKGQESYNKAKATPLVREMVDAACRSGASGEEDDEGSIPF